MVLSRLALMRRLEDWLELVQVISKDGGKRSADGMYYNAKLGKIFDHRDARTGAPRPMSYSASFRDSILHHSCFCSHGCCCAQV